MQSNDICKVTNRSNGYVTYRLPERHVSREFRPKETKKIPFYEIEELVATPGGRRLVFNYLFVEENVVKAVDMKPEPEYYLTEDKIDEWMTTCTLDEFKDALDFAPNGVKDLIKAHAITLPLNDMAKCEAIHKQLGFDVIRAIKNEKDTLADDDEVATTTNSRRTAPKEEVEGEPTRRTTPKYNVIKKEEA